MGLDCILSALQSRSGSRDRSITLGSADGFCRVPGIQKMFASPKNVFYDTYDAIQSITVVALFSDKSFVSKSEKIAKIMENEDF